MDGAAQGPGPLAVYDPYKKDSPGSAFLEVVGNQVLDVFWAEHVEVQGAVHHELVACLFVAGILRGIVLMKGFLFSLTVVLSAPERGEDPFHGVTPHWPERFRPS